VTNRPRLVVADDEALVRSVLCAQLEYEFECVGTAADAEEAIALVEAHRRDVGIRNTDPTTG
jgi:DNA-binding NarL/FixJ family response regulator